MAFFFDYITDWLIGFGKFVLTTQFYCFKEDVCNFESARVLKK